MTFSSIEAQRVAAWRKRDKKVLQIVAKEFGLLVVMFTVTLTVVALETGSLSKAVHIASIAGPIKALAAGLYGKITG